MLCMTVCGQVLRMLLQKREPLWLLFIHAAPCCLLLVGWAASGPYKCTVCVARLGSPHSAHAREAAPLLSCPCGVPCAVFLFYFWVNPRFVCLSAHGCGLFSIKALGT